jgi:sugar O-acyltransferase (sialic acid O-acetyltransferase NeuD family)
MRDVIVLGGGGHAKVVLNAARAAGLNVLGFSSSSLPVGTPSLGVRWLGDDEAILSGYPPTTALLIHGVGSVAAGTVRRAIFERFKGKGYSFASVIHPASTVAEIGGLGEGCVVMAGAVLQPGVLLEPNVIVNTNATVDHDCLVGAHTHIAPGATLSGGVRVGEDSLVGVGAVVIQGRQIGSRCMIGAGAVVVRDVPDGQRVWGVPAKPHP